MDDKQALKDTKAKMAQYENRMLHAQAEADRLAGLKTSLEKEIEEKRTAFTADVERKMLELRQATEALHQDRKKLEQEKAEFAEILLAHKRDRNALDREKTDVAAMKTNYEAMTESVGRFVILVKREAEKL